jgi:hypothetical protein
MIDLTQIKTAEQKAAEAAQQKLEQAEASRRTAYQQEADPLFFKAQRGEIEQQVWLEKIAEIKQRFPK